MAVPGAGHDADAQDVDDAEGSEAGDDGERAPLKNVQRALCANLAAAQAAALVQRANAIANSTDRQTTLARLNSQRGRGAMAFLAAGPSSHPWLTIRPDDMREALRRALAFHREHTGGLCGAPECNVELDGVHALRCSRCGEQVYRHDHVKEAIANALRSCCKVAVVVEDQLPFVNGGAPGLRMDITVAGGQMKIPYPMTAAGAPVPGCKPEHRDRGLLLDVYLADPTAQSHRAKAAREGGAALISGAEKKYTTYTGKYSQSSHTLIPFGVEIYGTLSPHAQRFLKAAAARSVVAGQGAHPYSYWMMRWRQFVSVALQRAASQSVARNMARSRAAGDGAIVTRSAHLQVRLLRRPPTHGQAAVDIAHNTVA